MNDQEIELRLPIDTPLEEVMDLWISAVVAKAGTQLKAAYALHIRPETVCKRLNRRRKKQGVRNEITNAQTENP
jgi:hypothetical protein